MLKQGSNCSDCERKFGPFVTRPLVFVGDTRKKTLVTQLVRLGWVRMWTDRTPDLRTIWAFDNGGFVAGRDGNPFPAARFSERLEAALSVGSPWLAVAPDLWGNKRKSLDLTTGWIDDLPKEWPWYFAVQDGMEIMDVEPHAHKFAGIFLGGSDANHSRARHWCEFAHCNGMRFHWGRAGTVAKMYEAQRIGADSLDSTAPMWTTQKFDRFVRAWRKGDPQPGLFDGEPPKAHSAGEEQRCRERETHTQAHRKRSIARWAG